MAPSNRARRPTCSSSPATRSTRPAGCAARSSTGGPAMRTERSGMVKVGMHLAWRRTPPPSPPRSGEGRLSLTVRHGLGREKPTIRSTVPDDRPSPHRGGEGEGLRRIRTAWGPITLALILGLGSFAHAQDQKPAAAKSPPIAIVGADIYTITKGIIKNGTILVQDGKILRVGTDIPIPDGAIRIDAKGKIVTPGFVTVRATNVALRGAGGAGGGRGPQPGAGIGTTGKLADSLNPLDRNILFCLASGSTT